MSEYNKKAFVGACDIIVAEQPCGTLKSTPFMLKAKNCVIGSKIGFNVNGIDNTDVGMIVNQHYEACFIEEKGENSKI